MSTRADRIGSRRPGRRWLAALAAACSAAAVIAAQPAWACSMCLSISDEAREAYYGTTVLLMLLPFLMMGGLLYWLRRAARRRQEQGDILGHHIGIPVGVSPATRPVPPDPLV